MNTRSLAVVVATLVLTLAAASTLTRPVQPSSPTEAPPRAVVFLR